MRKFLLTMFCCAKCGNALEVTYDIPDGIKQPSGQPTGATVVQQFIAVLPCQQCMQPLNEMKSAINTLFASVKE